MSLTADPPRPAETTAPRPPRPPRPLSVGAAAAGYAAAIGLTVLMTLTLVGWIAAPHASLGSGLPGVFCTAVQVWLVAHHAGFALEAGRVGLLPLGLVVLPGALLYRAGGWVARTTDGYRLRHAARSALCTALPYALIAGLLSFVGRTTLVHPSLWQALVAGFSVAFVAGGAGAAHAVAPSRGIDGFLRLLPDRPRSLVIGSFGATLVMIGAGAVLAGASLAVHLPQAARLSDRLSPGIVGGVLLTLLQVAFLPNAVLWGMAYALGPGFAVGAGTLVAPTGVILGPTPMFPLLAALPQPGPAPAVSLIALAAPFVAGVLGGVLMVRVAPTPVMEAAPLWGFVCGVITGMAAGALAACSGGPLGGGRLVAVGPSPWQVGLVAALEVGVSAAIAAWLGNWLLVRRRERRAAAGETAADEGAATSPGSPACAVCASPAAAGDARGTGDPDGPGGTAGPPRTPAVREPRRDIVDESDDLGGHVIYVDPWADERGS